MSKDAQLLLYHFVTSLFYIFTVVITPMSEYGNKYLGICVIKSSVQPPPQQKIMMWRRKLSCRRIKMNQGPVIPEIRKLRSGYIVWEKTLKKNESSLKAIGRLSQNYFSSGSEARWARNAYRNTTEVNINWETTAKI